MNPDHPCHQEGLHRLASVQLAAFDATIADLSDTDKKKRRIQYLNDIQQQMGPGKSFMESLEAFVKGMALYLMPLAILFLFLPLFFATRFRKMRWRASMDRQLTRALSYWRIDRTELESPT